MRKFVEGDKLTLEDVRQVIREAEAAGQMTINKDPSVRPIIKNGVAIFNCIEDAEKYYGSKILTLEEAFGGESSISENNEK